MEALVEFEGLLQLSKFLLSGSASILQGPCYLSRLLKLLRGPLVDQVVVWVEVLRLYLEGLSLTLMCL